MRLEQCEAIIFDSDGVLVDSEIIHVAVEREMLAEIGLVYDHEVYLSRFVGLSYPDYFRELKSDYASLTSGEFPSDFGERLDERIWPRIEAELKPMDGVEDLINAFGGQVAVASSAPIKRLTQKLSITGLLSLFSPHTYSAEHVANGKPAPDLFLYAAEQLDVPPRNCVVVEDSVNGVQAARAAQMTAIGFVGGGHTDPDLKRRLLTNGAEFVVSSHSEIEELL